MIGLGTLFRGPLGFITKISVSEFAQGLIVANVINFVSVILKEGSLSYCLFAFRMSVLTTEQFRR